MLIEIAAGLFIAIVGFNVLCAVVALPLWAIGAIIEEAGQPKPKLPPPKPFNWKPVVLFYAVLLGGAYALNYAPPQYLKALL